MSLFSIGTPVGAGLALMIGGYLIDHTPPSGVTIVQHHFSPWQFIFVLVGAPGLILAFLAFSFSEPRRGPQQNNSSSTRILLGFIRAHHRFYSRHVLGFGFMSLAGYGILLWTPAYMMRRFGLSAGAVGLTLATINIVPNIIGGIVIGW